ncbi:hypothetical protein [Novosphingobium sp.]|uniref:hypothetical protein n=1 Tax=Novosphingobium sp. TaxID=1874826 RepID=UPI0027340B03|nr:hypothetical protein [Novosphingobium sp.]MDP3907440.1 hypothetical protein [Novosphingobium sp.]
MTIRFASATATSAAFVKPVACADLPALAANDNAAETHDVLLRDALKHFARHGLRAAEVARQNAERAFFAGDRQSYRHWLEICRALDRRMAIACHARTEAGPR